jgi:probable F420-dependent oxidoreductase
VAIKFGVNVRSVRSGAAFERLIRRVEELGYDVLAAPDHLGSPAPFAVLNAAAMVSSRLRLRTYVLNAGFWNAALLAREVATLDVLSDGRAELGVGAGHMKAEHQDAGLAWLPLAERHLALERLVVEVRSRLDDSDHQPRPTQRRVSLMIGAMSHEGLEIAARHGDIVGFAGLRHSPTGAVGIVSNEDTKQRVAQVRRQAGGRPYRSDVLIQHVVLGEDPEAAAARIAAGHSTLTAEELLESPFMLLARDAEDAAATLRRRQQEYGFDSVSTHQPNLEPLAEVLAAYRSSA